MGFSLKSVRFILTVHTLFIINFCTFSHWTNGYFSRFFGYFKPFLGFSRLFYILYYACQITTIKDSFFASACARPVSVFPRLVKLSQNHMAKFENDTYWQKLIGEIMSGLDGQFPSTMPPDDQGRFIIGYYQQKNALWDKKSTETGKED